MDRNKNNYQSIDEYILLFPPDVQDKLRRLRNVIREAAPDAKETISYQMPAFEQNGILVYFAAFKNHIGFFPTSSGIAQFNDELSGYKGGKGSVQFPLDKPMPYELVSRIVKFRVAENMKNAKGKKKK
jgi:uncharacterized protein YdhG (YjbR/CyaY superfamily)